MQIPCGYDLQSYQTPKIDIECFVSDAHRTATQLDRATVFACHERIVLKSLRRLFRCRLDGVLGSRGAIGFNPASKTLTKHAYLAGFVDPGERRAAFGTG